MQLEWGSNVQGFFFKEGKRLFQMT